MIGSGLHKLFMRGEERRGIGHIVFTLEEVLGHFGQVHDIGFGDRLLFPLGVSSVSNLSFL
jgi:hypothetical protein